MYTIFFFNSNKAHLVVIYYGGIFVNDGCINVEKEYIGGEKLHLKVNVDKIESFDVVLKGIKSMLKEKLGNREVVKVHYRKPNQSLAHGLLLLYEGSLSSFLDVLKRKKKVELYIEHNISWVEKNLRAEVEICDLTIEARDGGSSSTV